MRIRKAVIPAAGMGTRLLPLTRSQPKEMLPVGRKPVIQYVVEEIQSAGIEHILIITTQSKRSIEDYFDGNTSLSAQVFYVHQRIRPGLPYGLAYAVGLSEGFASDDPFLVCLGDCIIKPDDSMDKMPLLKRLIHTHETHGAAATIAFEEVSLEKVSRYGVAKPRMDTGHHANTEEFQLEDIIEKPSREEAPSNLAVAARYVLEPEIFSCIKRTRPGAGGELQLTDAIKLLLKNGRAVWGVKLSKDEVRYDIGGFAGYFRAFFDFSLADEHFGEELRRYVREEYS
jgi:UTP--glucose-1-phosphate uridylyltransferase